MLLTEYLNQEGIDQDLVFVYEAVAKAAAAYCKELNPDLAGKVGTENESGDQQIQLDVIADNLFTDYLSKVSAVKALASEEKTGLLSVNSDGRYIVAFDPLDGSSLIGPNFTVGTIVGVYENEHLIGASGKDLVGAAYVMYGPTTLLVLTLVDKIAMFLRKGDDFYFVNADMKIGATEARTFAPGNLKAVNSNSGYAEIVRYWMDNNFRLRYSGGMVPDIHHILYSGEGVFVYPGTPESPTGKLRLVYECLPMAKIVETAGGGSSDGTRSILLKEIESLHQSTVICVGSKAEVKRFEEMVGDSKEFRV